MAAVTAQKVPNCIEPSNVDDALTRSNRYAFEAPTPGKTAAVASNVILRPEIVSNMASATNISKVVFNTLTKVNTPVGPNTYARATKYAPPKNSNTSANADVLKPSTTAVAPIIQAAIVQMKKSEATTRRLPPNKIDKARNNRHAIAIRASVSLIPPTKMLMVGAQSAPNNNHIGRLPAFLIADGCNVGRGCRRGRFKWWAFRSRLIWPQSTRSLADHIRI